jgi:hypothetical protein
MATASRESTTGHAEKSPAPSGSAATADAPVSSSASTTVQWRKFSAAHRQKYNLVDLPDEFEPTVEENILIDMYDLMRRQEREAKRLREEAARAKLAARDAEFQQSRQQPQTVTSPKVEKKKARKKERNADSGMEEDEASEHDGDTDSESDEYEDAETLHQRREKKLEALRVEVEEAKNSRETESDALRAQHLADVTEEMVGGPLLKKKRVDDISAVGQAKSLIANIIAASTPPHEFSEKLEFKRGKVLLPVVQAAGHMTVEPFWKPPEGVFGPNEGAFCVDLEDFDINKAQSGMGNNTLAVKFAAPTDSKRFSLNIALPQHNDFDSLLFHFNPRQHERGGQLILNAKNEGTWGQTLAIPLSQVPIIFGQTSVTLVIQINGSGFDVFIGDTLPMQHCARWEHKEEIPTDVNHLVLQFPSTDDYGSPENWTVYKVWWGHRPLMAKADASDVPGVEIFNAAHPRKLFVSGLSKLFKDADVELRKAELERAFRKYGGDRGMVQVIVPKNKTYAFVETATEAACDRALVEMSDEYSMYRARRTRHEALQEERALKEALQHAGGPRETTDWN